MVKRSRVSTGAKWEDIVGYSRAIRVGNNIEVSGTVALRDGKLVGKGDPYQQTVCIIEIIQNALEELGASLDDIIRTRMFTTDISHWKEIGRAHGEFFQKIKPVTTMVEVKGLVEPDFLIEMEATAWRAG